MGFEIDFLPVGDGEKSGDAIALRFGDLTNGQQTVVVVDGGFKKSGEELVAHIQKYYGTNRVDLVISTHPDADHASGLEVVLDELEVGVLLMHQPWSHADDIERMFKDGRVTDRSVRETLRKSLDNARRLNDLADSRGIQIVEPFAGVTYGDALRIVGPTREYYESLLPGYRGTPEPKAELGFVEQTFKAGVDLAKRIAESWGFETLDDSGETSAENNSSVIVMLHVDDKAALLTGDAGISALSEAADYIEGQGVDLSALQLVQVPHHGSKRNVGPTVLDRLIGPKQANDDKRRSAFVSASKDGAPKHPAKKVTNAFRRRGAHVYHTNGNKIWHRWNAPGRSDYSSIEPIPFYEEVEE